MSTQAITNQDIETFTGKLQTFAENLSDQEQILLSTILSLAADAPQEDVEGHMLHDPLAVNYAVQFAADNWHIAAHHLHHVAHVIATNVHHHAHHGTGIHIPQPHPPGMERPE